MTRLHKTLKNLELTMKEYKFSGEHAILIFDFLSRLVEEADTNGMSEGQLMVCLPHMLTKTAAQQYRAASNSSRSSGLKYWPEAVQYLLRTYATETAIHEAVDDLDNIRQGPTEDETAFATNHHRPSAQHWQPRRNKAAPQVQVARRVVKAVR